MGSERWGWIVPEGLWEIVRPLLPPARVRPQGGGVANIDDEAVFAAIVYVLVSGCAWCSAALFWSVEVDCASSVPDLVEGRCLGTAVPEGARDARRPGPDRPVSSGTRLRSRPRQKGGELAGPSPVDRGKPGSKMHVLSDAKGLPLRVGLSAANTHDSLGLKPMVAHFHVGHESHSDRFKPQRLHADKAYGVPDLRRWLHSQHIGVRIARKGIDSSERLGRRRWVIERTISWLTGYRRLSPRYERHPRNYLAFLGLAAALCCYKRLAKLTM
ncbi:IS5 family transposase [Streptomyces misionensis]|uniref:IS5 family transposase n=1 Tax=Streptomyces misionensis TaxID=67331 RepID=UPI0033FBCCCA